MSVIIKAGKVILTFCLVVSCLLVMAAAPALCHFWLFLRLPAKPSFETRQFFIPPKSGAFGVARLLESQEVVRDARAFYFLAWLRNSLHRLQAGEYAFSTLYTPEQVLDQIVNGRVVIHTATLPEGSTIWDVARIFEQKDLAPSADFLKLAGSAEFIKSLGLKAGSLEGYLFPETYHFKKPLDEAAIIRAMVREFWRNMPRDWAERAREVGLNLHEVVTMASIIEKEAIVDSERPVIAGVFYNRLKIKMPLQSDPTAVYDIPGFSGPVLAAHLSRQSPYNTYQIKGLPPGPICSPGAKSLKAALSPEKVPYFYFVSNNDGTHTFSVTVAEHQQAVGRYYRLKKKAAEEKDTREGPKPAQTDPSTNGPGAAEESGPAP
ncbi:MAG: endolytic transglycosylase MltG [Syntrophobacteraceae bacterium]